MSTTIKTYRMPWGETLRISCDTTDGKALILYEGADNTWLPTPYQTAHARHLDSEVLRLVVDHLGAEWYADPSSDKSHEEQLSAACKGAKLVSEVEE